MFFLQQTASNVNLVSPYSQIQGCNVVGKGLATKISKMA